MPADMDNTRTQTDRFVEASAEADEQRRLAREFDARNAETVGRRHLRTLRALADVDAGRLIEDKAMQAWVDSLGTDDERPPPEVG